jgi:metal-responsive CopG/Arc/MetJ family transcriptional regulator
MRTMTCKVPEHLHSELEAVAQRRGISKSELIREAIVQHLKSNQMHFSAYDVMKDGCGILKNQPRHLATHPKYMKGFGRS